MKRDMEVIRAILIAVESDKDSSKISGYDADTIRYHQSRIVEANLCHGTVQNVVSNTTNIPSTVIVKDLTWEGREFIAAVKDPTVWNTIKSDFKDVALETLVSVAIRLADNVAKKKVEELIKGDATV